MAHGPWPTDSPGIGSQPGFKTAATLHRSRRSALSTAWGFMLPVSAPPPPSVGRLAIDPRARLPPTHHLLTYPAGKRRMRPTSATIIRGVHSSILADEELQGWSVELGPRWCHRRCASTQGQLVLVSPPAAEVGPCSECHPDRCRRRAHLLFIAMAVWDGRLLILV